MDSMLSDAAFRAVVEEAPDAIVLVDATGRIAYINSQSEQVFGYERGELVGQRVEILVPEDRRPMHATHREVYQEEPERRPMGVGLQLAGRRKDGSTFPAEISLSPFGEPGAQLSVAVVRDVTRQRRAEETLRRSEERHRLLNERTENIVFRFHLAPTPRFEYISGSVKMRLGYAPEEFYVDAGLMVRLAHDDDRHVMEQALSEHAPRGASLRLVRRDQAVRWFELSITPVPNAEGVIVALEGIARDVTERRAADEDRLRLQSEVEMQLERNRLASDLHDDTVQSIYGLSLGLQAIRGDDSVTREDVVERTVEALNSVMAGLRAYMRGLSGAPGTTEEIEPLPARIDHLISAVGPPAWTVEIAPDIELSPEVARELYLLSKEMISNVQRHAQASSASFFLGRTDDGEIELRVSDDGVGFDPEAVAAESFGLRSLEMRAKALNARLDLQSAPGTGTRVRVVLSAVPESVRSSGS